jgi:hypothetical protein
MVKCCFALAALSAAVMGLAPATAATAATLTRDALERQLLDSCIYRQFQVEDVNRARMVDDCRCVAKTAMSGLEGDSFNQPRSGGLTGPQDKAMRAAIQVCFKP